MATTKKSAFSSAMATFGKNTLSAYNKATKEASRIPLLMDGLAILKKIDPVKEGQNTIETKNGPVTYEWDNHLLLTFDITIDGGTWEAQKRLHFESAEALEKFHKSVDYVVGETTKELSRYWSLDEQIEWLMTNKFPAYMSWFNNRECLRFGYANGDPKEAQKAIEEEQEK